MSGAGQLQFGLSLLPSLLPHLTQPLLPFLATYVVPIAALLHPLSVHLSSVSIIPPGDGPPLIATRLIEQYASRAERWEKSGARFLTVDEGGSVGIDGKVSEHDGGKILFLLLQPHDDALEFIQSYANFLPISRAHALGAENGSDSSNHNRELNPNYRTFCC